MLSAYADLIDGARSYYAKKEGDNWAAAFSAAMFLSFLFIVNLSAITALIDLVMNGELAAVPWIDANKTKAVLVLGAICAAHLYFSKISGVYDRRGGPRNPAWRGHMRVYIAATVCNFLLPLAIIIAMRYVHDD